MTNGPIISWMSVFGHPIHPMFVHFPAAAFLGLVGTDAAYFYTLDPFWARAGIWLLGAGSVIGTLAALIGWLDQLIVADIRRLITASCHGIMAVMMLSIAILNWGLRINYGSEVIVYWGIYLTLMTAGMTLLTSLLGGQLVYEHGVGVDTDS